MSNWFNTARTAEVAVAEVEFCRVLDGADVAREREALVAEELDIATVRLELANREGQLPCAHRDAAQKLSDQHLLNCTYTSTHPTGHSAPN